MKKTVVLNSGGFDSTVLLKYLKDDYKAELYSLYFHYGQLNDEIAAEFATKNAEKYCVSHTEITIPKIAWTKSAYYGNTYESFDERYLEARNLIFASYAVSFAQSIGADSIAMALIKDGVNMYPDTSRRFAKKLDRLCREFGISFKTPFIDIYKDALFNSAAAFKVDPDSFLSCDVPVNGKPCGVCPDCKAINNYKKHYNFLNK